MRLIELILFYAMLNFILLPLSGCGQTGPLYLPPQATAPLHRVHHSKAPASENQTQAQAQASSHSRSHQQHQTQATQAQTQGTNPNAH